MDMNDVISLNRHAFDQLIDRSIDTCRSSSMSVQITGLLAAGVNRMHSSITHTQTHTHTQNEGLARFDIRFRCSHLFPFHFLLPHRDERIH